MKVNQQMKRLPTSDNSFEQTKHVILDNINKESYLDTVPLEIVDMIIFQVPPSDIGTIYFINSLFRSRIVSVSFCKYYLKNDQELLHETLVTLGRVGIWSLFDYLWKIDIKMVKENRTLWQSAEEAFLNDKKSTSKKISGLNEKWMYNYLRIDTWNDPVDDGTPEIIFTYLEMKKASIESNMDVFIRCFNDLGRFMCPNIDIYDEDILDEDNLQLSSFREIVGKCASESNNIEFLRGFIAYLVANGAPFVDYICRTVTFYLLKKGRVEMMENVTSDEFVSIYLDQVIPWNVLMLSSRNDVVEIIKKKMNIDGNIYEHPSMQLLCSIGNRNLLLDYMKRCPNEQDVLINSFRGLNAHELLEKFNMDYVGELALNGITRAWKNAGYDYLVKIFRDTFKIDDIS